MPKSPTAQEYVELNDRTVAAFADYLGWGYAGVRDADRQNVATACTCYLHAHEREKAASQAQDSDSIPLRSVAWIYDFLRTGGYRRIWQESGIKAEILPQSGGLKLWVTVKEDVEEENEGDVRTIYKSVYFTAANREELDVLIHGITMGRMSKEAQE